MNPGDGRRTDVLRAGRGDRPRWLFAVVLTIGCSGGTDAASRDAAQLPRVLEVPLQSLEREARSVLSVIVVGNDGAVVIPAHGLREGSLTMVGDASGVPRDFGRPGEGPGEMRLPIPLLVDDTSVVGYDLATNRLMVFDRSSTRIEREFRPDRPIHPFMRGPGNTFIGSQTDRNVTTPFLIDRTTGRVRPVISPADTFRVWMFSDDDQYPSGADNIAVVGRWSDGVVLANGMNYRLGMYDLKGNLAHHVDRNVAPRRPTPDEIERHLASLSETPLGNTPSRLAQARSRLEARPVRWFSHTGGPRSDGAGRMWVMVNYGDSTAADVYHGAQLLGRIPFDCPGFTNRWDVSGSWLVMLCMPREPEAMHDAEVRRWRIEEQDG